MISFLKDLKKQFTRMKTLPGIAIERFTKRFFTSHTRPIFSKDVSIYINEKNPYLETAIIIQGALCDTHFFTLETVRLYKKFFPGTTIIVSARKDGNKEHFKEIEKEGVHIIYGEILENPGTVNINYQLDSTAAGIRKARSLGMKFILKTRTDQRMYSAQSLKYLQSMLSAFPVTVKSPQSKRLVVLSLNTFKYRPYSVNDMLMYGTIEDMERYWCIPFSIEKNTLPVVHSMIEWSKAKHAEVYLATNFLESIGHTLRFTLEDSLAVYRDYFCFIDKESLDLYWYKYDKEKEYRRIRYDTAYNDQELRFCDWLALVQGEEESHPESIIHQTFGGRLN